MSSGDLWFRDTIKYLTLAAISLMILTCLVWWKWTRFRQSHFRAYLLGFESECSELAAEHKQELFATLKHVVSHDPALKKTQKLRLLEIGVKTGDNLPFYPEGTIFVSVDWNTKLPSYLINSDRSWQFDHLTFERFIIGDGSNLKKVPTGYVDAVVTIRSLCSSKSMRKTLQEISRVLAPNGVYYFMEHVPEKRGTFVQFAQKILTQTKIWPSLFGGCRLDVNPIPQIEKNFRRVKWKSISLEGYVSQPHYLVLSKNHVIGFAMH